MITFMTTKTVVGKSQENNGHIGSRAWTRQCLRNGGGWHEAMVSYSCLQLEAPSGRLPFVALPLFPLPPLAAVPIGLSLACALPLPPLPW